MNICENCKTVQTNAQWEKQMFLIYGPVWKKYKDYEFSIKLKEEISKYY